MNITQKIQALAKQAGFDLFGVAPADPLEQERDRLSSWLVKGFAGEMSYLGNNVEKRLDPAKVMPSAKSIICLGMSYYYHFPSPIALDRESVKVCGGRPSPGTRLRVDEEVVVAERRKPGKARGKVARYAWGKDYHKVLKKKLKGLIKQIVDLAGPHTRCKEYTDTGPILERPLAARAGLGFIGKNTLLLHPKHGSWFFLCEILTNLELESNRPAKSNCGSCRACLDACPTQAFTGPYELDATRCISYWTIEARSDIPPEFHEAIGSHVFGCDICQEVCPFNRRPLPSHCEEFAPSVGAGPSLDLDPVLTMDEDLFHEAFAHTPLTRAKHSGIIRNAKIVLKNLCPPAS